jgi:hypothetical protein
MSGLPGNNVQTFALAAHILRAKGLHVVNPAEVKSARGSGWSDFMREDIKLLCDCDVVALLSGWEQSRGAKIEQRLARELGLKVVRFVDLLSFARDAF